MSLAVRHNLLLLLSFALMLPSLPGKDAIQALYKSIEGIVKTVAGPAADEIALVLRDRVREIRFRRQVRFFSKVKKLCSEAKIKPQAVRLPLLLDIIDRASVEPDDELQDLWANLLANAADPTYKGLISTAFPEILRQLSRDEAAFLEEFYTRSRYSSEQFAEMTRMRLTTKPPSISDVYEDNLKRLGLIEQIEKEGPPPSAYSATGTPRLPSPREWKPTAFGGAFVDACTNPKKRKRDK